MKRFRPLSLLLVFVCFASAAYSQANAPLKMSQTIPLPGVEGRIDHMSVDVKGQRLFVAALGNNTVEVVDLAQGKRSRSITGLKEPQGIVYIPTLDQVVVANGADGTVRTFDARSFTTISSLDLGDDADNVRYDSTVGRLVVGYGDGALGMIDLKTHKACGKDRFTEDDGFHSSAVECFLDRRAARAEFHDCCCVVACARGAGRDGRANAPILRSSGREPA